MNRTCIACHGGIKQHGGFSVFFPEEAVLKCESGDCAIIPAHPENSETNRRISLNDPEERVSYKDEPLSKNPISILRNWIKQRAEWGEHRTYVAVEETAVTDLIKDWMKNDIDKFIQGKMND